MQRLRVPLALLPTLALTLAFGACSIEDSSGEQRPSRDDTSTALPASSTTLPGSDAVDDRSSAYVEVGGVAYDLDAECHAAGAGEIVITALTADAAEPRVELYLQAFLAEPYVGIAVTTPTATVTYEPGLDLPLDIVQQGDVYRVDDAALVTDLDLETGVGVDAGTGTVVVECASYSVGLPPGFDPG